MPPLGRKKPAILQRVVYRMRLLLVKSILIISLAFSLQGCETLQGLMSKDSSSKEDEYKDWDEQRFHDQAKEALDNKNFQKAVSMYEAMEARYPFGDYTPQAQLNVAYAYYKNDDPEAAIAAAEQLRPDLFLRQGSQAHGVQVQIGSRLAARLQVFCQRLRHCSGVDLACGRKQHRSAVKEKLHRVLPAAERQSIRVEAGSRCGGRIRWHPQANARW